MKTILAFLVLNYLACNAFSQEKLQLYSSAPNFTGKDQYDKELVLYSLLKEGPVVLFFYRGQWCPHCNRYMSNLQDSVELVHKLGAKVVAITPERIDNIAKTVLKTKAMFSIVYDENHKIMDRYKVTFKLAYGKNLMYNAAGININKASGNSDRVLPVPATYIIEKNGRIIGAHFNEDYSKRMPVSRIIDILKKRNEKLRKVEE